MPSPGGGGGQPEQREGSGAGVSPVPARRQPGQPGPTVPAATAAPTVSDSPTRDPLEERILAVLRETVFAHARQSTREDDLGKPRDEAQEAAVYRDVIATALRRMRSDDERFADRSDFPEVLRKMQGDSEPILQAVLAETVGYGPLSSLMQDRAVREIMVNGPDQIVVERGGDLELTGLRFRSEGHLLHVVDKILLPRGKQVNLAHPMADARLDDGSRLNVVLPPLSLVGPAVTIRRFPKDPPSLESLAERGTMSSQMCRFLTLCVLGRMNIGVCGGTSSGKTTLLNALGQCVPGHERIVTIEDTAELQIKNQYWLPLEARTPNHEGKGEISIRDLLRNALRMRPDRIIVGECRGAEVLDMLQAMNTGHDGSMTTLHANSPRDAVARLEMMTLMAGVVLPIEAIDRQIAASIQLIVHQERLAGGVRRVTQITEVEGFAEKNVVLTDVYKYRVDPSGGGRSEATGVRPKLEERLLKRGLRLPGDLFER
ncbi:MAG: CpaF family protein [Candidatus Riflebacteria bacterium]|nr:CpaF family protein [Candidatus Riflebacteria bacterium]